MFLYVIGNYRISDVSVIMNELLKLQTRSFYTLTCNRVFVEVLRIHVTWSQFTSINVMFLACAY